MLSVSWYFYFDPRFKRYEEEIIDYKEQIISFENKCSDIGVNNLLQNISTIKSELRRLENEYRNIEAKYEDSLKEIELRENTIEQLKKQITEEQLRYVTIKGKITPPFFGVAKKIRFISVIDGSEFGKPVITDQYTLNLMSDINYKVEVYCGRWIFLGWQTNEEAYYVGNDKPIITLDLKCR